MSRASVEGLLVSSWGSFPGLAKLTDYVSPEVTESVTPEVWNLQSLELCKSGSLEDGPSTATGGRESGQYRGRAVAPIPRGPGPGGAPQGEEVVVARRRGLEAANRKRRSKAEEALLEALRRLQARGERCLAIPPFQGLLGALQAAVGGLAGEGQTPDPDPGLPPTLWPHTFPLPGGLLPPASPRGVYAGIPGDPPQLHARRPPLRALPGPSPARR
jgi:hypothetical protein